MLEGERARHLGSPESEGLSLFSTKFTERQQLLLKEEAEEGESHVFDSLSEPKLIYLLRQSSLFIY